MCILGERFYFHPYLVFTHHSPLNYFCYLISLSNYTFNPTIYGLVPSLYPSLCFLLALDLATARWGKGNEVLVLAERLGDDSEGKPYQEVGAKNGDVDILGINWVFGQ